MIFPRRLKHLTALVLAAMSVFGCEVETFDDGVARFNEGNPTAPPPPAPPPPGPPPPPAPPPPPGVVMPVFSDIQAQIFTPTCATSSCHAGGAPAAGLNLTAGNSYAALVGIASTEDANIMRVVPFDAANSYLMQVLDGTAASGTVDAAIRHAAASPVSTRSGRGSTTARWMTRSQPPAAHRYRSADVIRRRPTVPSTPRHVTQVVAGFTREVNATTQSTARNFHPRAQRRRRLRQWRRRPWRSLRAPAASRRAAMNPLAAVFDLTGVALPDDLCISDAAARQRDRVPFLDLDNNMLDGEFSGMFASGRRHGGRGFRGAVHGAGTRVAIGPDPRRRYRRLSSGRPARPPNCHDSDDHDAHAARSQRRRTRPSFASLVNRDKPAAERR